MTRTVRLGIALATCALIAAIPTVAAAPASGPTATASRACGLGDKERRTFPPATYVNSISVRNVSCRKGKRVTRAFHACRRSHGGANGRCPNRVQRFRCRETRSGVPGVQYNGRVVCRRGGKKVVSTYTQNV